MSRRVALAFALSALVVLLAATAVRADRRATTKERAQVAKAVELPAPCARVRISTVATGARWASAYWRPGSLKCKPFARDGVAVLKRKSKPGARWRFITAGSDFFCRDLHDIVPEAVANDLGIDCH